MTTQIGSHIEQISIHKNVFNLLDFGVFIVSVLAAAVLFSGIVILTYREDCISTKRKQSDAETAKYLFMESLIEQRQQIFFLA